MFPYYKLNKIKRNSYSVDRIDIFVKSEVKSILI